MKIDQARTIAYPAFSPFELQIHYVETDRREPGSLHDQHVHAECEICIHLTGDVSFVVENRIYPILPGDIVIARPYEYHHCIYHSDSLHRHFWILFSSGGNEALLTPFFDRPGGEQNLLRLPPEQGRELIELCHGMLKPPASRIEECYRFLRLLRLLELAKSPVPSVQMPEDVSLVLEYIHRHPEEPLSVRRLAERVHVSVNTLERHFGEALQISPSAYIRKKRLSIAAEQLSRGVSVTEACQASGFSDYSNFIALFKSHYGLTPLQYQKKVHRPT